MKNRKLISLLLVTAATSWVTTNSLQAAKRELLTSPNQQIKVEVHTDKELAYQVMHGTDTLLALSPIGLSLADGTEVGKAPRMQQLKRRSATEEIEAPFYRFSHFTSSYNELSFKISAHFGVTFRAYDEGVAYRFYTTNNQTTIIQSEQAEFNFAADHTAYLPYSTNEKDELAMAFQNIYHVTPLSKAETKLAFLPVTVDCGKGKKVTLLESDVEAYPGMFVQAQGDKHALKGVFATYPSKTDFYPWRKQEYVTQRYNYLAQSSGKRSYPWRILAITEKDSDMPVNNLVYALASPNRIGDTSWIETGKVAWDWWNDWNLKGVPFKAGINMDTYKYYIDFASKNKIEFVVLDEGWYTPQSGDMLTVVPELNLPQLVEYAKERNVGIILWAVFNVLDAQLEEACQTYSKMGIKGFKIDFLDRDDQTAAEMTYRIAEATAKHKLTLDLHGYHKPTGINRTYPHIINFEGVFGMEEVKWTELEKDMPLYDVTFPFIRMMAGPVDYTPGAMRNATKADWKAVYYNPMSMGTRCHQLAAYIIHDSPLTMLCDAPTNYLDQSEQACVDFIATLPVVVEETRVLQGELGKVIVTARRKGSEWYVGGMTNWDERQVTLDLSFLEEGKSYQATLFVDGINANKQAEDYRIETITVTKQTKLPIQMASGGGFALRILP